MESFRKRLICLFLAFALCLCSVCSCLAVSVVPVHAGSFYDGYRIGKDIVDTIVGSIGKGFKFGIGSPAESLNWAADIYDAMKRLYPDSYDAETDTWDTQSENSPIYYNSETEQFNITKNFYTTINQTVKSNVAALDGYYLIEDSGYADSLYDYWYGKCSEMGISDKTQYSYFATLWSNTFYSYIHHSIGFVVQAGRSNYLPVFSVTNIDEDILYIKNSSVYKPDGSSFSFMRIDGRDKEYPVELSSGDYVSFSSFSSYGNFRYIGSPLMIFYNKTAYDNYMNQGRNYYVPQVNYPETGINIPLNLLSGNQLSDLFNVNIERADGMTSEELQELLDDAVQQIIDGLSNGDVPVDPDNPDIPDPPVVPDYNYSSYLSLILGALNKILEQVKEIPTHIVLLQTHLSGIKEQLYTAFHDFNFSTLLDTIKDSGGGGGGIGSGIGSAVGTVVGNLISDLLDKIFNGKEEVEDAVGDLVSRFSGLADTSKTKFPFSLPWDVMTVFAVLAHDPETPVFKFPIKITSIGFDYEVTLDLKDFDGMSKLSRSFFTVIFCMIMIRLTLLMVNRGDLD